MDRSKHSSPPHLLASDQAGVWFGQGLRRLLFVVVLLVVTIASQGQTIDEDNIKKIDGVKYVVHVVEQGHTLYAISKLYSVEVKDITESNPGAEEGIRIGQELLIPYKAIDKKEVKTNSPKLEGHHLVHKVIAKETLYSITKRYNVEDTELVKYNPFLVDGLKVGQNLIIPLAAVETAPEHEVRPAMQDTLVNHKVVAGETLFSLAKKYEVNMDSILLVNPHMGLDLTEGQKVRIPRRIPKQVVSVSTLPGALPQWDSTSNKVDIGLLLPLYLENNAAIEQERHNEEGLSIYKRSFIGLRFLEGFNLALEQAAIDSLDLTVKVIDTGNDTARVDSIIQTGTLDDLEMIVGPLYLSSLERVIKYVGDSLPGTNVICPVPQSNKVLLGNDFVVKVHPSNAIQSRRMADHVVAAHGGSNIVILGGDDKNSRKLTNIFKGRVDVRLSMASAAREDSVKLLFLTDYDEDLIRSQLSVSNENVVCIPSTDQAFVTDVLTKLHHLTDTSNFGYNVTVFGLEKWKNYNNIDVGYLHDLNVHLASSSYVNYQDDRIKSFLLQFRNEYGTDPDKYAFAGYDLGRFLVEQVKQHQSPAQNYLDSVKEEGLTRGFDFFKTGLESGFENQFTYILKYENFELVLVD